MKGYNVYSKIQQFHSAGFGQRQVARRLGINRKTVKRYWEMPADEYEEMSGTICRIQYLEKYRGQIWGWLQEFPDMTAAQVCDWLKEHYREKVSERTVSRYVKQLREAYELKRDNLWAICVPSSMEWGTLHCKTRCAGSAAEIRG